MRNRDSFTYCVLVIFLLLICFPKSFIDDYSHIRLIINLLKMIFGTVIILFYFNYLRKNKMSKFTFFFLIFIILTFISSYINKRDLLYFFKTYYINISVLLCSELVYNNIHKKRIINNLSFYLYVLLIINIITVILKAILGYRMFISQSTYFLGMDNRFFLFIIPCMILNYSLYIKSNDNKYKRRFIISYLIGTISLLLTWSVSSFLIMLLLGVFIMFFISKNKVISSKIFLIIYLIVNYLIVIFKIQNIFADFIINTLNKSITLSYRTILWDNAIKLIISKPIYQIIGLGYFNTETIIPIYYNGGGVNHLHNLLVDISFSSGLSGLIIYILALRLIAKRIDEIMIIKIRCVLSLLFFSILLYLVFESFELYPIYYLLLCILYYSNLLIRSDSL